MTRLAWLFGHPVAHSVSPAIHNAAFAALGLDARYEARDVPPARLAEAVGELRAGGPDRTLGANCTIPHKLAVLDLVDGRSDETALIGAGNTLYWEGGRLLADNTDARGLERAIRAEFPDLAPGPAAVLGAGGAARAAVVALARMGFAVTVLARRAAAAQSLAELAAGLGGEAHGAGLARADTLVPAAGLVVNATPLGLHGEPLPEPFMSLRPGQTALDLVYGPDETPFVAAARRAGARAGDGLGMLVAQAALSFERWTGATAPEPAMTQAAKDALNRGKTG